MGYYVEHDDPSPFSTWIIEPIFLSFTTSSTGISEMQKKKESYNKFLQII